MATRRFSRLLAVALALGLLLTQAPPADAASKRPADRRREVQRKKAQAATKVNVLKATEKELERALDDLDRHVRAEQSKVDGARRSAAAAGAAAAAATRRQQGIEARIADVRGRMRRAAVDAYVHDADETAWLDAEDITQASTKRHLLSVVGDKSGDLADQLRALRQDAQIEREAAERARAEATRRRAEAEAGLAQVTEARRAKQRVADQVEARLERALAEASALEALDRRAAAELAARQRGIADKVGTGGRASGPARQVGNISVTTVRGITVATSLAPSLERLLAAADADGIALSGAGYRDSSSQVAARRAHCGSSSYDIYEKPASQCRPPTARPGQSMHERGLAIDFTYNGGLIRSRDNAGFRWLKANAGRFGLQNLPSEPWHWSTNGN